ncbi:hypothetical protein D3C76_1780750 [compost metagenome]
MRPVGLKRFLLLFRFLLNHLPADDQITQQRQFDARRRFKREREHVGRLIFPTIGQVQVMAFCFIHQANRDF